MTAHFLVYGRVQGVFFRTAARHEAGRRGLGGWVRNTPDGCVEGMVSGEAAALAEFRQWLHRGPDMARVLKVEWEVVAEREFDGFMVR